MTILKSKVTFILRGNEMNWYVIFVNEDKINDLIVYFNNQPGMSAFVPKIEKLMTREGKYF